VHEVPSTGETALTEAARALEARLEQARHEPPTEPELGDDAEWLTALVAHQRAVRIGRNMWAARAAADDVRQRVSDYIERNGAITLAALRDELNTSRKFAQAWLEHLDNERITLRRPDDTRVLRARHRPPAAP